MNIIVVKFGVISYMGVDQTKHFTGELSILFGSAVVKHTDIALNNWYHQ